MAKKITIQPSELWEYLQKQKSLLNETMYGVASNDEFGIEIYVSTNERNQFVIVVEHDDSEVYREVVLNANDCLKTAEKIYDKYLSSSVVSILDDLPDDGLDLTEQEDAIEERESELDALVYEFVMGVLGGEAYYDGDGDEFDEMLEDLKDHFLEYMARKHDLPIFRPMFLEYDDGTEEYDEYPYENMEFEDEDNPIYMN